MTFLRIAALGLTLAGAGCNLLSGRCVYELRGVEIAAILAGPAAADSGAAGLSLYERRSGEGHPSTEQDVTYHARSTLDRTRVSAVHVHTGTAANPGPVVFDMPIRPLGAASVITVSYTQEPYEGAIDFRRLFALVRDSVTHFDIHVEGGIQPTMAGASFLASPPTEWTRPYCS